MFTTATVGYPQPLDEPDKWSAEFKDFLSNCLAYNPLHRMTAEELLSHSFLKKAPETRDTMERILSEVFLQKAMSLF